MDAYLEVCRTTLPVPQLELGKTGPRRFAGMRFLCTGNFVIKNLKNLEKLKNHKDFADMTRLTKQRLESMISLMGGENITDGIFKTLCAKYSKVPHCYLVLPDDTQYQAYINAQDNKLTSAFCQSTRGYFTYLKVQYIIDCFVEDKLLDIEYKDIDDQLIYKFAFDESRFVKNKRLATSRNLDRQRAAVGSSTRAIVLAKTELKRTIKRRKKELKESKETERETDSSLTKKQRTALKLRKKRVHQLQVKLTNSKISVSAAAWILFLNHFTDGRKDLYSKANGKTDNKTLNKAASDYWKAYPDTRKEFAAKARTLQGTR